MANLMPLSWVVGIIILTKMPKITGIIIQTNNKNRCNLFVDGEFYASASLQTIMEHRLKKDQDIEFIELKNVLKESEKHEALTKAISYVSKSLKTKRQVKDYLLRKGFCEETVWYCIDKLKEYAYIDDKEYSKRFIESTSATQGKKLIEYKLMSKGVKKEDFEFAFSETEINSKENAKCVAEKYLRNKEKTKEVLIKAYRYLISRGFSYDDAEYALSEFRDKRD